MERNENGLGVTPRKEGMPDGIIMEGVGCSRCANRQLAMVYAPMQCFRRLYKPDEALMSGTLFEELYKPLEEVV